MGSNSIFQNNITIYNLILLLLITHYIVDFILQYNNMAIYKSSSLKWLYIHSMIYGICFIWVRVYFVLINTLLHSIDYISSRVAKYFSLKKIDIIFSW